MTLWGDRMQFWQTPNFFPKILKVTKRLIELQKKVPKIVPLDSQYAVMITQIKLWPLSEFIRSKSAKQKRSFLKTLFISECSSGHNERNFGHTANFLAKNPKTV